jgi:hypothetical protein
MQKAFDYKNEVLWFRVLNLLARDKELFDLSVLPNSCVLVSLVLVIASTCTSATCNTKLTMASLSLIFLKVSLNTPECSVPVKSYILLYPHHVFLDFEIQSIGS